MNDRTPLSQAAIDEIRQEYPVLPEGYLDYMAAVGYGEAESGRMIYGGPVSPDEIYGDRFAGSPVILLGDDMQGYCLGFDTESGCLGEISDFGEWEPWSKERSFLSTTMAPPDEE